MQHSNSQPRHSDEHLCRQATAFLLALMASASTKKIPPKDWWERGATALRTAASRSRCPSSLVTGACGKLQIDVLRKESASSISSLMDEVRPHFPEFRRYCERNSVFIASMAQTERAEQRAAAEEVRPVWEMHQAERDRRERAEQELERARNRVRELEEDNRVLRAHAKETKP